GKRLLALDGRVMADRLPAATRVTTSPEEQDYPAAAVSNAGDVWLAYLEFTHNPQHNRLRANLIAPPVDFRQLAAPTGGDRIQVRRLSGGRWENPIAITPPGRDLYRPAIALDGKERPWVFWSENTGA